MDKIEVPAVLLESLETSFDVLGRNLLRDVGQVLNIPYKELVKKVYGDSSNPNNQFRKICLEPNTNTRTNTTITETTCRALIKHNDGAYMCGKIAKSESIFCTKHFESPTLFNTTGAIELKRLKGIGDELWATPEGIVVNKDGLIKGYVKNGVLFRYK